MQQLLGQLRFPAESMNQPRHPWVHPLFQAEQTVGGLHQMYNQGFAHRLGNRCLTHKGRFLQLHRCRCQLVQSCFAHGQHLWMARHGLKLFPSLLRHFIGQRPRMDSHRIPSFRAGREAVRRAIDDAGLAGLYRTVVCMNIKISIHGWGGKVKAPGHIQIHPKDGSATDAARPDTVL